jgi:hypothetical protein
MEVILHFRLIAERPRVVPIVDTLPLETLPGLGRALGLGRRRASARSSSESVG